MTLINQLGRALFDAHHDVERILDALATALTMSLCDGCAIWLPDANTPVAKHRTDPDETLSGFTAVVADARAIHHFESAQDARAALPAACAAYIDRFGLCGLAVLPLSARRTGVVIATRDAGSPAFDDDDLGAIESCVDYASGGLDRAWQVAAERSALRIEREHTAQFHREMLRLLGHDLRAPLGGILLGTELLAIESTSDPAARRITRIVGFAKRMTRIVDQVLDLSRSRLGGGIPLARINTRLSPLVTCMIDDVTRSYPGARVGLDAAPDIRGNWDPDRIGQVVRSMVTNAVQYGREDAPIHVAVSKSEDGATITVHNELRGNALSASAQTTMFEPHDRDSDPDHVGTGVGLGMFIASEIVRAHRGTIGVESSASGTTFRVVLPST